MNIRNRTADVIRLRCHMCQDFIRMIAVDNWQTILYTFMHSAVTGSHKDNYIEQYKVMRKKGIENYSFDDMDVPFIVSILRFCPGIAVSPIAKSTSKELNSIKKDRHVTNHSSENEPEEELYLRALVSLRDLQDFLHTVDLEETAILDEKRSQFVQNYTKDIDALKLEIYNDCIELFQVKKDVQLILASDNQSKTFLQMFESYNKKALLSDANKTQMSRFLIEASNAGIKSAHQHAAICCSDFDEATRRYEMMIDSTEKLSVSQAHQLIDFVNHMYIIERNPTERVARLAKIVKNQGFDIAVTPGGVVWNKKR